jgi:hypothetical protein
VALSDASTRRASWLERVGAISGIVFAVLVIISFFTSDDYGETPQSVLAYAEASEGGIWLTGVTGLLTPLLVGLFVVAVASWLGGGGSLRTLVVLMGGIATTLITVGLTIWSAPLLDDTLNTATAETYLALDDFGWVIIGTGGVALGVMIAAASLAAARLGLVPGWAGWLGAVLGVVALASVAAVGLFAWLAWFIAAGIVMLITRPRPEARTV